MQTDLDRKTVSAASLPHLVEMLAKEACSSEKPCDCEWCSGEKKTAVDNGVKRRPVYFHASSFHTFSAANLRPQPMLEPYLFTNLRAL